MGNDIRKMMEGIAPRKQKRAERNYNYGYVYIYRFWLKSEWCYKFRLEPAWSASLELWRVIWVTGRGSTFIKKIMANNGATLIGGSYSLSPRLLKWLADVPTGRPPGGFNPPLGFIAQPEKPVHENGMRNTNGYVYLLEEVNGTHFKIGRTRNPDNRIRTFSVKLPYRVEYAHLIETDDMYTLEAELHARFAHCRVDGEWFALTPSDVNYIKSL